MTDPKKTGRISTKISLEVKENWHNFLINKHGAIKNVYGKEMEKALDMYMASFVNTDHSDQPLISHRSLSELNRISSALRKLPSYPFVTPLIINSTIKRYAHASTQRTRRRYRDIVIKYSKSSMESPVRYNVEPFVEFVESSLLRKELA